MRELRRRPVNVLFCPSTTIPLAAPVPAVVTIHDVSFASHPEWFHLKSRLAFALAGPSARRAARVLTVSRFSADEIVAHLRVPAGKTGGDSARHRPAMLEPPAAAESQAFRNGSGHAGALPVASGCGA